MTALDAIRLTTMLVLSALLAVLVIAGIFHASENAAGVVHAGSHRAPSIRRVLAGAHAGAAWAQSLGRRQAQRQRAWGVSRGQAPRPVRNGPRSTGPRS